MFSCMIETLSVLPRKSSAILGNVRKRLPGPKIKLLRMRRKVIVFFFKVVVKFEPKKYQCLKGSEPMTAATPGSWSLCDQRSTVKGNLINSALNSLRVTWIS